MSDRNSYLAPFPRRLRLLIDENRCSQQEIADFVGVTRQAESHWKDGKTIPDCFSFKKLAEFFKVPMEYLYGDTDSKVRENLALKESLGLSDQVIAKFQDWAQDEQYGSSLPLMDILSRIMEESNFDEFVFAMHLMVVDYLESRFYEDEEQDDASDAELLQASLSVNGQMMQYGLKAVPRATIAELNRYRAMESFGYATRIAVEKIYKDYREGLVEIRSAHGKRNQADKQEG